MGGINLQLFNIVIVQHYSNDSWFEVGFHKLLTARFCFLNSYFIAASFVCIVMVVVFVGHTKNRSCMSDNVCNVGGEMGCLYIVLPFVWQH